MKRMIRIVALLMVALMMVTSCQAPDSGSQLASETVDVSFAGPSARTITTDDGLVQTVATSDLWFQYKAVWKGSGDPPSTATNEWTSLDGQGLSGTIKLHRGVWNLSLRAFVNQSDVNNDSKFILSGTREGVEIGTNNMVTQTVSINLGYVRQEGNGTLHINATYPVIYHEAANPGDSPVEAVRKVKVTAHVSGTDYTGEITAFDSNNVGSLDLTIPAGAAHVTVQYYMDDSTLFEDDQTSKDVLIMATMTTNLAVSVDRDITAVTFTAGQPAGTVEDNLIKATSLFDIYPDEIADNAIVIGYAEETKALGDQTPITYPYISDLTVSKDDKGRYRASDLGLVPITVTTGTDLKTSGATEAWWGKTAVGRDVNMEESNTTLVSVKFVDGVTEIKDYAFLGFVALTSVEIPDSVTSIGTAAFVACQGLTSVTIPEGVTSMGTYAFTECTGLTSVTIQDGVTEIGSAAFGNCSGLTSVTIPVSITSIGDSAFYGCSLTSLNYSGNREQWNRVAYTDDVDVICLDGNAMYKTGKNTDGEGLYVAGLTPYGKNNCTELFIPNCVTSIRGGAFKNCTGLISVTIPEGVTSIEQEAFYGCTTLTSITISDSVTSIGNSAFSGCTSLTSVTIPKGVTSISYSAFSNCTGLTSVTIPDSVTEIRNYAFSNCVTLTSVTIPDSVTEIESYAFNRCTGLTSVTIPKCVTSIEKQAFNGCTGLTNVTYTGTIEQWYAFGYAWEYGFNDVDITCKNGKAVFTTKKTTFNDGTVSLSVYGCTPYGKANCPEITIPEGVTEIGNSAFTGRTSLTSVTIPQSVTSIGNEAFIGCSNLTSITIPDSVTSIGEYAFDGCEGLTEIQLSNSLTSIGRYAFENCTGLISITIPSSVTEFGFGAFSGCTSLNSVTIQNGVTKINNNAFFGCTDLTNITIPASVTEIGQKAFWRCEGLTSITIPSSVTSIGKEAFEFCTGLTSITIPSSVTSIGSGAFSRCTALTNIYVDQAQNDTLFANASVPSGTCTIHWNSTGSASV